MYTKMCGNNRGKQFARRTYESFTCSLLVPNEFSVIPTRTVANEKKKINK